MEVIDRLPSIGSAIHDNSVASLGNPQFPRDALDGQPQVSQQSRIFLLELLQGHNGFLGDDQDMDRGLRRHVMKGQADFVFVDNIRRNFLANDFGKDSLCHVRWILEWFSCLRRRISVS